MSASNGSTAGLSPAEQLKARHAANSGTDHTHTVTVEDTVDEEDIAHPPPSSLVHPPPSTSADAGPPTMSDIAKGKQKADGNTAPAPRGQPLNLNSEEAFPSLGAPKRGPATTAQSWGKPPASATKATPPSNGTLASAPSAGRVAAGVSGTSGQGAATQAGLVNLPGRSVERITLTPAQMIPRQQMKKPIPEVLRDINKRSKARVEYRTAPEGIVFEGTGPIDAVRQALKEVASQVGSKQSISVAVPAAARPFIIGRQGQTVQNLAKRTGARITIPKQDAPTAPVDDDEEATVTVTIEGDAVAAELARREIINIVGERNLSSTMRLKDIPAEFYPFLTGPRDVNLQRLSGGQDVNINIPHYHTWQESPPPQSVRGQPTPFVPQAAFPIRISGDREAAQATRARIERQVQALRQQLTSQELPIERARHQFIVGKSGESIHDLLHQTGCSVVVPPAHEDSEFLHIIGPPEKIDRAVDHIMDIASSMAVQNVDPSRAHPRAPANHAYDLTRYLQQRQALAAIEQQYNASIALPSSSEQAASWQIFSRDGKQGMRARTDVMNLIAGHPPARFQPFEVHPFFHQHLQSRAAPQLRRAHGVHILFPQDVESPKLVLVYERPGSPSEYEFPSQAPSQAELQEYQKVLKAAVEQLMGIVGADHKIVSRQVEAPPKYHDKIRRYVDREHRNLPEHQIPAQLLFNRLQGTPAGAFNIRGTANDVDGLQAKILAFIEQEKQDEVERGFTMSFEYPQQFANVLIGRRGDNIKKISEEYDVEVNYQEGKVELKGPKAKCEAAKAHILSMAKKLEDEANHSLKIPQQYHADLKGSKGSQVIRLQDRYNVRINFPRQAPAPGEDDATEGSVKNFSNQAPDIVTIRGPRKGADDAREELLNLLQYVKDTSHTDTISVSQKQIPSLIGAGGRELEWLRGTTGARIDIPNKEDHDESGRVDIRLKGTKKQVEDAKKLLKERVTVFDDTIFKKLEVDPKFYKTIIGPSGATLRDIVVNAGGPDDARQLNRIVQLPKPGSGDNMIKIEGRKAVVDKIVAAIESKVSEVSSHVTETMTVPPEQQRLLIGAGGSKRREIEDDFQITLNIPKQETKGPERSQIKFIGRSENVQKAMDHIQSILKEQASDTISIPTVYHHLVADDGAFFRRLRNDLRVTVDHDGATIPARPATAGASRSRNVNGGSMPLITDDAGPDTTAHSWELVDHAPNGNSDESETVPWILRGSSENVAKAKTQVEKALANARKPSATGFLILPDPKLYRLVIGQGGATINGIRGKTGVQITVPRQGSNDEAIEIKGSRDGVEKAKELVLEAVEKGPQRKR